MAVAGIVEWGTQEYDITLDPRLISGEFWGFTGTGGGGERDRYAVGGEVLVPVDSMINLSQLDWKSEKPDLEAVAVRPILTELSSEFLGKAAEKGLELEVDAVDCAVLSDRVCLSQILRNLIENAIKHNIISSGI